MGDLELRIGYSPCPNDTLVFHALVHDLVPTPGVRWSPVLEDVETLNRWAIDVTLPVTKLSFHALGYLRESYALLRSGGALGRGCGPLVVAREAGLELRSARVAIPGQRTSAALLLRLFEPSLEAEQLVEMSFDRILGAVSRGEVDAGLIIHESRFTYAREGLVSLVDLGDWWESTTGQPIPLGGIVADRRLGVDVIQRIDRALAESVRYARAHPEASASYVREHAQELADDVTRQHIDLYVNDFTVDLGQEGLAAVEFLFEEGKRRGVLPSCELPLTAGRC